MGVIFATSSTRIGSRAFVHFVATASPARVTERQFSSFWGDYWWLFVKGYHAMEYFVLALLLIGRGAFGLLTCSLVAMAFAVTDEWHQTFVPYRGGRWTDVAIDWGGVLLALAWVGLRGLRKRYASDVGAERESKLSSLQKGPLPRPNSKWRRRRTNTM